MVGQRFLQLLEAHPQFRVTWLGASDRSSGKPYREAAKWRLATPMPEAVADIVVSPAEPDSAPKVIFAALDADIARDMEPRFAASGRAVITNSSAFRMHPDVPLVIPEVNADALALIETQEWFRNSGGYIVTNPNCCAIGLVMALAPLVRAFGVEAISVTTMQAVSGAGYPGVASMDILGNVVPFIRNEEEKLESETLKLLGRTRNGRVEPLGAKITASCNRVAVEDGHTESVSVKLSAKASADDIIAAWQDYAPLAGSGMFSAPEQPIVYLREQDRPQPRLDVNRGRGMTTTIGRLRPCGVLDWKFTVVSHNVIRGAAGAALLNAELLAAQGRLLPRVPAEATART